MKGMSMRRNRKNSVKKERTIMLVSSAFVLAALTMTGLYMKGQEIREQDDGYTLDFAALEDSVDNKYQEIAQGEQDKGSENVNVAQGNPEDDLDYMPLEAGSGLVEIPGLTDGQENLEGPIILSEEPVQGQVQTEGEQEKNPQKELPETSSEQDSSGEEPAREEQQSVAARELHFSETSGLVRPVSGEVILPYSMDSSVYFATLDQYKRNPATVFQAAEGTAVSACAAGRVVNIFDDEEIGHAVEVDLGDGYRVIYGQLTDIQVSLENYIEAGDKLGTVAAPTKYYSSEGANLYFRMEKDGQPMDPQKLF